MWRNVAVCVGKFGVFAPAERGSVSVTVAGETYVVKGVRNYNKGFRNDPRQFGLPNVLPNEYRRIRLRGRKAIVIFQDETAALYHDPETRRRVRAQFSFLGSRTTASDRQLGERIGEPFPASAIGGLDAIPKGTRSAAT
jgi:hypothetical protein